MKITSFNPMVLTEHAEEVIGFFEGLGFQKKHAPTVDTGKSMVTDITMEDANGFRIDVAGIPTAPKDITIIRMNVDDFDAAYAMLEEKGFTNTSGKVVETESNKSAMMVSPSGYAFDLCQHIRKEA